MVSVLTQLQYQILKRVARVNGSSGTTGEAYAGKNKLKILLGEQLLADLKGKVVVDFGCGEGAEAVELAKAGVSKVIGVDIRESALQRARQGARDAGLAEQCEFCQVPTEQAHAIVSLDSFEHFEQPGHILQIMFDLLTPGGFVVTSFGPTWYHPYGGHLFSVFPWAHLIFEEKALIQWRSEIRNDGATRFSEVEGGLNQMTIRRFEHLVQESPFHLERLEPVPIRKLSAVHNSLTREFTTAIVRAKLVKPLG